MKDVAFALLISLGFTLFGCAQPKPALTWAEKEQVIKTAAQSVAEAMLTSDALPDREMVITATEEWPSIAPQSLPEGNFRIDRRSKDKVPRVEITMIDGPECGEQFTCNLLTSPDGLPSSLCSGEAGSIPASCVDRRICFPVFTCSCEAPVPPFRPYTRD